MFDERFDTFVADTRLSKSIHYKIRYQVYCLERRFENSAAFPDRQETDNYDKNSVHFIVRHRKSGQWMGAMRLVLAVPGQLPLTRVSTIDTDAIRGLTGSMVAEASRLCVLPARIPESEQITKSTELRDIFHPSSVTLGLIRAAREYCLGHDIQFSFFLITDQLARILQRIGMEIKSVGPATDHRGLRRPYIHDFEDGYRRMRDRSPLIYDMFQASPAYKYHSDTYARTLRQPRIQLVF